jgi:hypothetical protein
MIGWLLDELRGCGGFIPLYPTSSSSDSLQRGNLWGGLRGGFGRGDKYNYLWVADPRQVTFLCSRERKVTKRKRARRFAPLRGVPSQRLKNRRREPNSPAANNAARARSGVSRFDFYCVLLGCIYGMVKPCAHTVCCALGCATRI